MQLPMISIIFFNFLIFYFSFQYVENNVNVWAKMSYMKTIGYVMIETFLFFFPHPYVLRNSSLSSYPTPWPQPFFPNYITRLPLNLITVIYLFILCQLLWIQRFYVIHVSKTSVLSPGPEENLSVSHGY